MPWHTKLFLYEQENDHVDEEIQQEADANLLRSDFEGLDISCTPTFLMIFPS